MLLRTSTWGEFWSCSAFPSCKGKKTVAAHNFDVLHAEDELSYPSETSFESEEEQDELVFFSADVNENRLNPLPKLIIQKFPSLAR
jgi:ssDNA-binding Zn-finger/Zn-ribbon topoisomerase 1